MAGWEKHWQMNELASTALEWLAENGGYYAAFFALGRWLPRAQDEQKESLAEMLFTETVDIIVRFTLLWLGPQIFVSRELGVAVGSTAADVLFALTLRHSHRLVEIVLISCYGMKGCLRASANRCGFIGSWILTAVNVCRIPEELQVLIRPDIGLRTQYDLALV